MLHNPGSTASGSAADGGAKELPLLPLAFACALAVSVPYLSQPVLPLIGASFSLDAAAAGLIVTLTQAGYATGLLFLVPLADRIAGQKLIIMLVLCNLLSASACAGASSFVMLLAASYALGATAVSAQIIIPVVSGSMPASRRGKVLGALVGGMAAGPLLARTLSGFVASSASWRDVFFLAAGLDALLLICVFWTLPAAPSAGNLSWPSLMRSLVQLLRQSKPLQEASLSGAISFGVFSAVWASLASLLAQPPYQFAPAIIGLFGLVGAISIVAAPVTGAWLNRAGSRRLLVIASAVSLLAVVGLGLSGKNLLVLVLCLGGLDLANRVSLVANQARAQNAAQHAEARANTVFMTAYFTGGAIGAATGSFATTVAGWAGLSVCGSLMATLALLVSACARPR
ncbi:MFS transporter [Mesorhizobium sp. CO1-1-8]|uniref:MFS transporter n=1 Tax=Mesorhizobium sp. CO1-1-8 TaxID=2876631 RepID=UPI001CD078A9|nr:MFS transporter [Mesorhizobium sp. CO1-1-8]MBZ9772368.1 MFS transporter [Mesorhizobium sp. CO1-1-8]